jgi:putative FmdB family regulatory protein
MPFYEYECSNCKFYVETLQKISDEPLKKCPSCKKPTLKKLISAPVFRLKGAGWYETDFKSEGEDKRNIADREEPAEKSEDSKSKGDAAAGDAKAEKAEKKAESKAESKAEVKTAAGKRAPAKGAPAKGKKPAAKAPAKRPAPKKAAPAKKKAKRR